MSFGISQTFISNSSNSIVGRFARIDPIEQGKIEKKEKEELERQEKIKKGEIVDMFYSFNEDEEEEKKQEEKTEEEKKADEEKERQNKSVISASTAYSSIINRFHNINSSDYM